MISVLYDPLFTALYADGAARKLGLMELLTDAHLIDEIKAFSCTGKFALLRLCIAFLSDAYRPQTLGDRRALLEQGHFDREILERYASACEAEGASFALDDPKHPFMQAAFDEELDENARKAVANILFDVPSGNNHIHFDHRSEDQHAVDTAHAFEAMLEVYAFCTPMAQGYPSSVNNTPPLYAVLYGDSLFQTLVLNMLSKDEMGSIPYGGGEVAWRRMEKIVPKSSVTEMSFLKALTWQPRRLTLSWDEDGLVRGIYYQQGLDFRGNYLWKDPHALYAKTKDGTLVTKLPSLGRQLWRDSGLLLRDEKNGRSTIPLVNISGVWDEYIEPYLQIELLGLATDKGAVLGRVQECLRLPRQLFEREDDAWAFRDALEMIETMYRSLMSSVLWQFCHPSDKKKKSAIAEQAGEGFLHAMRSVLFGSYLEELAEGCTFTERNAHLMDAMREALENVLRDIVEKTGDDVPSMKRQNAVRAKIMKEYNGLRERSCGPNA